MRLMREVRFFLTAEPGTVSVSNSWAGSGATNDAVAFWVLRAIVDGGVDEETGYLCSLGTLDELLRGEVISSLRRRIGAVPSDLDAMAEALRQVFPVARQACAGPVTLVELAWHLSPYLRLAVEKASSEMVSMTQSFEFSAAHRLHCTSMSEEENRRIFGKCANPNGHGHNYVLEVTVRGTVDPKNARFIELPRLENIVKSSVIDRFDHKHLNKDCVEFRTLNPSVENIARVIWQRLEESLASESIGGGLAAIRVWETPKTYAEDHGEPPKLSLPAI